MRTPSSLPSPRPRWKRRLLWLLPVLIVSPFVVRFALSTAESTDEKEPRAPARSERPRPRLSGRTIDGGHADTELFRNRRGFVYVFATTNRDAEPVA